MHFKIQVITTAYVAYRTPSQSSRYCSETHVYNAVAVCRAHADWIFMAVIIQVLLCIWRIVSCYGTWLFSTVISMKTRNGEDEVI